MKTVFFIRHAKSSWKDPDLRDIERPLNKRGLRDAPFMAKLLVGKSGKPDAIISSPAVRAITTARFFATEAEIGNSDIVVENDLYEAFPGDVFEILQRQPEAWNSLWLFGHNPTFTTLANSFSGDYLQNVPTCGIVEIRTEIEKWADLAPGRGERVNFYYPKQYFD
jgi:phosphohistidine phosphatase